MKKVCLRKIFMLVLALSILMSYVIVPVPALGAAGDWDNAMHFIIRHWHAVSDSNEQNFTVVEGYITPDRPGNPTKYDFDITVDGERVSNAGSSEYIKSMDQAAGVIELGITPINGEKFSGVSVSAGHYAVSFGNKTMGAITEDDAITITYDKDVHLVKSHVFYIADAQTVKGFDGDDTPDGSDYLWSNPEKDTAYVYVYKEGVKDSNGSDIGGDVVLDDNGNAIEVILDKYGNVVSEKSDRLPAGVKSSDVELSKVYNTGAGLHTDKTASVHKYADDTTDDRTFDLTLEAWYGGLTPANVAMILDASGSMAFTSDSLDAINISDAGLSPQQLNTLNRKKLTNDNVYTDEDGIKTADWDNIFLNDTEINWLLDPNKTDNSPLAVSGYNYYVFDERGDTNEFAPLGYWDGHDYTPPKRPEPTAEPTPSPTPKPTPVPTAAPTAPPVMYTFANDTKSTINSDITFKVNNIELTYIMDSSQTSTSSYGEGNTFEDGFTAPNKINFGGGSIFNTHRVFSFTPPSAGTVTVYIGNPNSTSGTRNCRIKQDGNDDGIVGANGGEKKSGTVTVNASTPVYIGADGNNIDIYGIVFTAANGTETVFTFDAPIDGDIKAGIDFGNGVKYIGPNGSAYAAGGKASDFGETDSALVDFVFPNRIKLGGKSDSNYNTTNVFEFTPPSTGSIKVYFMHGSNGGDETRSCIIYQNGEEIGRNGTKNGAKGIVSTDITSTDPIYIGGDSNISIYGIAFYSDEVPEPEPTAIPEPEYDEIYTFDNAAYENGETVSAGNIANESAIYFGYGNTLIYYSSSSGSASSYSKSSHTFTDGLEFSSRIRTGGVSDWSTTTFTRTFVFTPPKSGTIRVYFYNNGTGRGCSIEQPGYVAKKEVYTDRSDGYDIAEAVVAAGAPVYIGTTQNSDIYGITLTYGDGPDPIPTPTPDPYPEERYIVTAANGRTIGYENGAFLKGAYEYGGWYYVTHNGNWTPDYMNAGFQTAKNLVGIQENTGTKKITIEDESTGEPVETTVPLDTQFYDWVRLPANYPAEKNLPGDTTGKGENDDGGTGARYDVTENTKTRFYIDANGYLRCFFAVSGISSDANDASNDNIRDKKSRFMTSYVYEYADSGYIKVEALQRAVGAFNTKLGQASPSSKVSAVRFSSSSAPEGEGNLVMLDWTNDTKESTGMFSLKRSLSATDSYGDGTIDGEASGRYLEDEGGNRILDEYNNPIPVIQYNYGLTGNTETARGFQTFNKYLRGEEDEGANKYIIVFTDGKDTSWNGDDDVVDEETGEILSSPWKELEALKEAKELREADYTIFGVMLSGGSVAPKEKGGNGDYEKARRFLEYLTGERDMDSKQLVGFDENGNWVGGTDAKGNDIEIERDEDGDLMYDSDDNLLSHITGAAKRVYTTDEMIVGENENSVDVLVNIFSQEILTKITKQLDDYTVQDYVDPRFDLVDNENRQWHLNADGKVVVNSVEYNLSTGEPAAIGSNDFGVRTDTDDDGVDDDKHYLRITFDDGRTARLYYDGAADMYYLKWRGQVIPCNAYNAEDIQVWSTTVTVRAKDDFIGGNTVMTNGNAEYQNYVFSPDEKSGKIAGTVSSGTDDSAADAAHPSKGFPRTTVDVGPVSGEDEEAKILYMGERLTLDDIITQFTAWSGDEHANLYYDYLYRYAAYYGLNDDWFRALFSDADNETTFTIPYYYLPNCTDSENQINSTGTELHEGDLLGYLTYTWTPDASDNGAQYPEGPDASPYPDSGYIKDTKPRKSTLTVVYTPKSEEQRQTGAYAEMSDDYLVEGVTVNNDGSVGITFSSTIDKGDNDALVTEKDKEDNPVYLWDNDYKPTAGEEQEATDPTTGDIGREFVSGEIVLQAVIKKEVISYLLGLDNPPESITYSAALYREIDGVRELVGTYNVTYTLPSSAPETDVTVPAVLTLDNGFIKGQEVYDGYGSNAKDTGKHNGYDKNGNAITYDAPTYGLPIGTYTLEVKAQSTGIGSLLFSDITSVEIDSSNKELFGKNTDMLTPVEPERADELQAPAGGNTAYLGTGESGIYTNQRYALFQIDLDIDVGAIEVEKEVTGGGENDKLFEFTVTLTEPDGIEINPANFTVTGASVGGWTEAPEGTWTGTFKLKDGQKIRIDGIPDGVEYTIKETDRAGYNLMKAETENGTVKGGINEYYGEGEIAEGAVHSYLFVNAPPVELPEAGGAGRVILFYLLGGMLVVVWSIYDLIRRKSTIR